MSAQALILGAFTVSLAALIVGIGLDAEVDDLLYLFRRPAQLAKAVLAVNVIVPIAAVLLVFVFPLSPIAKTGVLLMAVSPAPPLVPGKGLNVGAAKSYAYGLYTALVVLAVGIVPLAVSLLARLYGVDVSIAPAAIARNVALSVLLPLGVGLAVRRLAPAFARRALPPIKAFASILLALATAILLGAVWPAMLRLVGNGTILAMALTAIIALAAGHLLGGPEPRERAALALTAVTRHPGIAMMIAKANEADKGVAAAILTMLLVGVLVAAPYQRWIKRRAGPVAAAHA